MAQARVEALRAELDYLRGVEAKEAVCSPIGGTVTTPWLKEKIGEHVQEGDLICEVEDRTSFVVDISLAEEDAVRIEPGQAVRIKVRALPYQTFESAVLHVAPIATAAKADQSQSQVHVYCELDDRLALLRSQMTGYARIYGVKRPIGLIALDRAVRLLRTEFWW